MKKGKIENFDIYQLYMAFVQDSLSRSIQCEYNEQELFEQNGDTAQASWHWEMAKTLEYVLEYLLTWKNFKEWSENRHEA